MRGEDEAANPLRAFGKIRGVSATSMVSGKLPSGAPFITAASKTISGRIPLFTTTPRHAESLCGWVNIERTEDGDFIAGDLCWSGKQNVEAMLALEGGEFAEPSTGAIIDGFGAEGNAVISFTGGGLLSGVSENVRISANNQIRMRGAATQMSVELTVDRHGCVSGTQQSIGSRPRGVHGIVIPDASGGPSLIEGFWFQGDQVGVWEILPE